MIGKPSGPTAGTLPLQILLLNVNIHDGRVLFGTRREQKRRTSYCVLSLVCLLQVHPMVVI